MVEKVTEAQNRFSLLDRIPIGVCVIQCDGAILFWNICLEDWTRIPREQILGTQITEHFPHLARPIYASRLQQIFQGGPPAIFSAQLHRYVIPAALPQGRWRIQHTTVTSVPAFDGEGFYALLSIQDVTDLTNRVQEYRELRDRALTEVQERQRAETELVQAREAAEAAARIKSQFLANMSHEIRTPMNGVLGMAELLLKTHLTTQQQNFAQVISNSANHLLTIINDILDFSKLEAGEMRLQTIDFDLNDCIDTVIEVLSSQAEEKGLKLAVCIDSQVNQKLQGDPIRLRQILLNLVSNAIKFTDAGEVVLAISRGVGDGGSGGWGDGEMISLLFSVRDTGIGISEEGQQKLFQSFSQVDASSTRQYGGTGLGLTICKQIVEQMGGEIGVTSAIGQGSTFWFTAQFSVQDTTTVTQPSVIANDTQENNLVGLKNHQINILIAEDNLVNQQVLLNQLEILGYHADFVVNGEQALAMLSQQNYDVVLMDCQMPVIDGYTATQELRRREGSNRHTVVIALTANAMPEDREKCLASGMDDYISKPINLSLLNALLQRWAGSRAIISEVEEIIPTPSSIPVNLARLEEVTRGNKSRQQRLLQIFIENAQTDIQAIAQAIPINDYSTLEQKTHRLKGSSANVGVTYISDLAAELEILSNAQTLSTAPLLLNAIDSHLNKVQTFLQTHFSTESQD